MECGYWARKDILAPPNESGPGATYGVAVHALTEEHGTGVAPNPETYMKLTDEELNKAKIDAWSLFQWHSKHIGGDKHHEQKVAFNVDTRSARILSNPKPRDYSECAPEEFPGTADLIAVKPDAVCVLDYKTGHTPWEIYKPQLETLGLCAAKIYNRSRVVCVVLKVSDGECYPHHWTMEAERLSEFEAKFVDAFNRVPGSEPTPGHHCVNLYCPLAGTCPATLGKLSEELGVPLDSIRTDASIDSVTQAQNLYELKLLMGKSKKTLEDSLKRYVDEWGVLPLSNGKVYTKKGGSYKEVRPQVDTTDQHS